MIDESHTLGPGSNEVIIMNFIRPPTSNSLMKYMEKNLAITSPRYIIHMIYYASSLAWLYRGFTVVDVKSYFR